MTVTCKLRLATGEHGIVHQTPCGDHANGWNASRSVRGRAQASANQNPFGATSNEGLLPTRAEETYELPWPVHPRLARTPPLVTAPLNPLSS